MIEIRYINFEVLYDGQLIIGIFILVSFLLFFLKKPKDLLIVNVALNLLFIIYLVLTAFLESYFEHSMIAIADSLEFFEYLYELLEMNKDRFLGAGLYFLINQLLIVRMFFLMKRGVTK